MTFAIGQRWISNTEPQLGLGIITAVSGRHVNINFPATGEERIYAANNAPLSRIIYKEGDEIFTFNQYKLTLTAVDENDGVFTYTGLDEQGKSVKVTEPALDCFIKLTTPQQRLFSGQFDKLTSFKLRIDSLNHTNRLQQSQVRGLLGSRTSHLPHQLYIAHEVAQRYAPRVLLADEVGLGKTIEAGMILHYQLYTGRASRVLIVVPNSLIHQWLVEMLRRFNLRFAIIDQSRYEKLELEEEEFKEGTDFDLEDELSINRENPFDQEQLVLCSLDFLLVNEQAGQDAQAADWDLLIVDEAHHLQWSESQASPEYSYIERLAQQSKGLLLLTATPEQVGIESHFARLRLLDPARFYDFERFKQEEASYQQLNQLVQKLLAHQETTQTEAVSEELIAELAPFLIVTKTSKLSEVITQLLDRHGTGRVLFRNTRAAIQGFPERRLHTYPLAKPALYAGNEEENIQLRLCPETKHEPELWLREDPRVSWLVAKLKELYPEKVLIICAQAETALLLEDYLKQKIGIRSTSFHEGLSIIERDRAAAYFSEQENGAQALICSEIGSEGRNFQFAHHLVLFDLPLNPDLLEQRIGRLDRIGQRHPIEIHLPYLEASAQETLFLWYQEGINLFEQSCSVGFTIYQAFADRLLPLLQANQNGKDAEAFAKLLADTKDYSVQLRLSLSEGRDRLLEINSCKLAQAQELISAIEAEEDSAELENYMADVFQEYGIEHEYHSEASEILRPTDHMKTSHFPCLSEDGVSVTYSRAKALIRDDLEFLSWEHPMVSEAMEMILGSELGNASLGTISVKGLPPGTLLLETFYTLNCAAPKQLQLNRFLPLSPIRLLVDVSGKNLSKVLAYSQLNRLCEKLRRHMGQAIVKQIRTEVEIMVKHSEKFAQQQLAGLIEQAKDKMRTQLDYEISRLCALQKLNPNIRDEEVHFLEQQLSESESLITKASLKLEALRVIITK